MLRQGRYRLLEQLSLPENQRDHGVAWLAADSQNPQGKVIVREIPLLAELPANRSQVARAIALHHTELGQHPGFPRVIDVFNEQDSYFLVLQYPEGESLATLLRKQGGALPERMVAEFGRQLTEMLVVMARQNPPVVHGAISPETIIVSPDRKRVSLLHIPLFPPKEVPNSKAPAGYRAPEQVRGQAEVASDMYAVAATLHYAVTGYDPNERMAFFHPPARRLNPAVTPRMEAILSQALRLSVQQRYARPADMQRDFAALLASYGPETEHPRTPITAPITLDSFELRQRSRNRSLLDMGIFAGIGLLVLAGFLLFYLNPFARLAGNSSPSASLTATAQAFQQAYANELALEARAYQQSGIGISDGRYAFDVYAGRNDVDDKKQAALALQHGDLSTASQLLTKSVNEDPTDGEAQIYNEDLHVLQRGGAYLTIVLGLPINSSDIDISHFRYFMQSGYLMQHRVNNQHLLPNGLQLRILIDSSGANLTDVARAAQFIANRVKAGNPDHIIGVVGWPFSKQTINAKDVVASVHLPIVTPTASSTQLSGSSPYFFRVNPPDDQQGLQLGKYAVNVLSAKKILVLRDPADPYSNSLADAFTKSVSSLHAIAINNQGDYFTEGKTTVQDYQKQVSDAVANQVNLIFIAGFDVDGVRLAVAIGNASRANPTSVFLKNLKVLGGDGLDSLMLLGQNGGPDAALARQYPGDMQRLSFTAFGHPQEWALMHVPQSQYPPFFSDWASAYQSSGVAANNAPDPGNDAMLSYDAFGVLIKAASMVHGLITGQAVRDELTKFGTSNIPPYQGVSGQIHFGPDGNPVDKAVVVLAVVNVNGRNQIQLLQITGKFQ